MVILTGAIVSVIGTQPVTIFTSTIAMFDADSCGTYLSFNQRSVDFCRVKPQIKQLTFLTLVGIGD